MAHVRLATAEDAGAITRLALEVQDWHVAGRPDIFKPGGYDDVPDVAPPRDPGTPDETEHDRWLRAQRPPHWE